MAAGIKFDFGSIKIEPRIFTSKDKPPCHAIASEEDVKLHPWCAVKKVGVAYTSGVNPRNKWLNSHTSIDCFRSDAKQAYFGVFAGHGGDKVSSYYWD